MIIQLKNDITADQLAVVEAKVDSINYKINEVKTQYATYLVCVGTDDFDIRNVGGLEGIQDVHRVSDPYKLVSSKWKVGRTVVDLGDGVKIGGDEPVSLMAGPCSIEGEEQIQSTIAHLKENNIKIMRGGVYKPRSSPYSFRGAGIEMLKLWYQYAHEAGIKIITEVMQSSQIEEMYPYTDIFQVGARNTQNFNLLDALGEVDKAVMIKRGISGTIDELLSSAEYVFSGGNEKLLLCERGIRTFEKATRNTFDINAIPVLREKSHLPVVSDPSHGIGIRRHVGAIAAASVVAGADAVIFEVHSNPSKAFSDGQQTLDYPQSARLVNQLRVLDQL